MQFKKGQYFQSHDAPHIWNKLNQFNQTHKNLQSRIPKRKLWSWGQVAGAAVAEFNKSVKRGNI
jgi:hypothetical protein